MHISHPRAAIPCRFSVSPCSQKVGAVLEIWGYTLNSCFYSIHKQNPDNCGTKNNCGKEGKRPWAQPVLPRVWRHKAASESLPRSLLDHWALTPLKKTFTPQISFQRFCPVGLNVVTSDVFPWLPLGSCSILSEPSVTDHPLLFRQGLLWLSPIAPVASSRTTLTNSTPVKSFWELKLVLPRQEKGSKQKINFFWGYYFLWRRLCRTKPCSRKEFIKRWN